MTRPLSLRSYTAPPETLATTSLPIVRSGLLLGFDTSDEQPLVVDVLRDRPTQVGVFGTSFVAQLLAFRAIALGAHIVVLTHTPAAWGPLRQSLPGPPWLSVLPPRSQIPRAGSATAPSCVVADTGVAAEGLRRDVGPWQTVVTVSTRVTPQARNDLRVFDLLAMQRMPPPDAEQLCAGYGLPDVVVGWLADLPADVAILATPNRVRFARLSLSRTEREMLRQPQSATT